MEREIQAEITNVCPNDCIHCSSYDLRMKHHSNPVDANKLENIVRRIPGKKIVYLTGGEPLCAPHLNDFCESLRSIPETRIGLFTCGIQKKSGVLKSVDLFCASELYENGISECYVSLYGSNAETHNLITNSDSFSLTCESIKNFIKAGISTNAHIVLTKQTIPCLSEVIEFAVELGMKSVRLLQLVKTGSAVWNWDLIGIDARSHIDAIINVIGDWHSSGRIPVSLSGFPQFMPCRPSKGAIGCQRGTGVLYISYDGFIHPCACAKTDDSEQLGTLDDVDTTICNLHRFDNITCFEECLNHSST